MQLFVAKKFASVVVAGSVAAATMSNMARAADHLNVGDPSVKAFSFWSISSCWVASPI